MLSHVPKAKGCRQKRLQAGYLLVSTELGIFWAAGYFRIGWRKKNREVPCCHVPKPGMSTKDSKLGVFVSTEMGILGPLGILGSGEYNFPLYSGPIMSECQI